MPTLPPDAAAGALSVREAAARLGVHERTVRRAIARGELDATRSGRSYAIPRSALDRYGRQRDARRRPRVRGFTIAPLPARPTSFVGRNALITTVTRLVLGGGGRVVTLIGPGGGGKTRLALEVAERTAASFPDGVAFVSLAAIDDPDLVLPTIAETLGLASDARPPAARLRRVLARARVLLVLDNLEQVRAAGPELAAVIAACPHLAILATSRVRLGVAAETIIPVPPLTLPDDLPGAPDTAAAMAHGVERAEAVRLFVARACAVAPAFTLTDANAADLAAICQRLDGLPLAIELAAARIRHLHPADLRRRLERALPVLIDGPGDAPARQRTLQDAIAWSHDLLTPGERVLFRRLAVFAGSFDGDAVAMVVGAISGHGAIQRGEAACAPGDAALAGLSSLVDQQMLCVQPLADRDRHGARTRYALLETIREFGIDQLVAHGEAGPVRDAHAAWCLDLATRANDERTGPAQAGWFDRLTQEQPNLRAALAWLLAQQDHARGFALIRALAWFWTSRGFVREADRWTRAFLALPAAASDPARGWVLLEAANIVQWQGDTAAAVTYAREAVACFAVTGERRGRGYAQRQLGSIAIDRGALDEAARHLAASYAILVEDGVPWDGAFARYLDGRLALAHGQLDPAVRRFAAAATAFAALGDREYLAAAHCQRGAALLLHGASVDARAAYRAGLAFAQAVGQPYWLALALSGAACLAAQAGRRAQATRLYRVAMRMLDDAGHQALDAAVAELLAASLGGDDGTGVPAVSARDVDRAVREATALLADDDADGRDEAAGPLAELTPREREVLALLARGCSDKEIAATLRLARHTAGNHVAAIRRKLGVPSRAAAAALAVRHGG